MYKRQALSRYSLIALGNVGNHLALVLVPRNTKMPASDAPATSAKYTLSLIHI